MLILLPPSEGKAVPRRGKPLDLSGLSFPGLTSAREHVLDALVDLAHRDDAARVLGLGGTQGDLVELDRRLRTAATARADRVYTGVLYDALDLALPLPRAHGGGPRRGSRSRRRCSGWSARTTGSRRTGSPATSRCPASARWPASGGARSIPRSAKALGGGLLVDLRSSTYAAFWRPAADLAPRVATVRVLHEVDGRRQVVSHFNKATKGRLTRVLLEDGRTPRRPAALADVLRDLGWKVEVGEPTKAGTRLDVVVDAI